jgi:tetratricopeptide (TPR) repeat protein
MYYLFNRHYWDDLYIEILKQDDIHKTYKFTMEHGPSSNYRVLINKFDYAYLFEKLDNESNRTGAMDNALGLMYEFGLGCEKSEETSLYYFISASLKGYSGGLINLGDYHYKNGEYAKSFEYYKDAAENHNNGLGYDRMSNMYIKGLHVQKNVQESLKCLKIAHDLGMPVMYDYASTYFKMREYDKACEYMWKSFSQDRLIVALPVYMFIKIITTVLKYVENN